MDSCSTQNKACSQIFARAFKLFRTFELKLVLFFLFVFFNLNLKCLNFIKRVLTFM